MTTKGHLLISIETLILPCLKIPERHTTILNWNGPFSWPGKVLPFLQNNSDITPPQHVEGKLPWVTQPSTSSNCGEIEQNAGCLCFQDIHLLEGKCTCGTGRLAWKSGWPSGSLQHVYHVEKWSFEVSCWCWTDGSFDALMIQFQFTVISCDAIHNPLPSQQEGCKPYRSLYLNSCWFYRFLVRLGKNALFFVYTFGYIQIQGISPPESRSPDLPIRRYPVKSLNSGAVGHIMLAQKDVYGKVYDISGPRCAYISF